MVVESTEEAAPNFYFETSYDAENLHTVELSTVSSLSEPEQAIVPMDVSLEFVQ